MFSASLMQLLNFIRILFFFVVNLMLLAFFCGLCLFHLQVDDAFILSEPNPGDDLVSLYIAHS